LENDDPREPRLRDLCRRAAFFGKEAGSERRRARRGHDLMATEDYRHARPPVVRDHIVRAMVDRLVPAIRKHDIEGLPMGLP
jgi:hypothetical protein